MWNRLVIIITAAVLCLTLLSCLPGFNYHTSSLGYHSVDKYDHEYESLVDSLSVKISAFVNGSFKPTYVRPVLIWIKLTNSRSSVTTWSLSDVRLISDVRSYRPDTVRLGHKMFGIGPDMPIDTVIELPIRKTAGVQLAFMLDYGDNIEHFRIELGSIHFQHFDSICLSPVEFYFAEKE